MHRLLTVLLLSFLAQASFAQANQHLRDTTLYFVTRGIDCVLRAEKTTDSSIGFLYVDSTPNLELKCRCQSKNENLVSNVMNNQMQGLTLVYRLCGVITIDSVDYVRVVYDFVDDEMEQTERVYVLIGWEGMLSHQRLKYRLGYSATVLSFYLENSREDFLQSFPAGYEELAEKEYATFQYFK